MLKGPAGQHMLYDNQSSPGYGFHMPSTGAVHSWPAVCFDSEFRVKPSCGRTLRPASARKQDTWPDRRQGQKQRAQFQPL